MKWQFSPKRPSDKTRDPVAGEFFASDAIKNAGEALVREGIQNSLDARMGNRNGLARVRIYLSGTGNAVAPERMRLWIDGARDHLVAPNNGLRGSESALTGRCQYLVFEDFGTTGLVGDPEAIEAIDGDRNAFFYFFRAEGKTEKSGDDRGRWGIGKQVFPRSSRVQMYFGYTETEAGPRLMGGCVLKHHKVDGRVFKPDGYGGIQIDRDGDRFTVPVEDAAEIEAFRQDFRITRRNQEYGLSIVVPWIDNGDEDSSPSSFNRDALALSVLDGYFLPIMEGRLEVLIEDGSGSYRLASDTFQQILDDLTAVFGNERQAETVRRLRSLVGLAEACGPGTIASFAIGPCPSDKPRWTDDMVTREMASEVRTKLDGGLPVRIAAELTVRPKIGAPERAAFECYLTKQAGAVGKPCHVREDLIISNVRCTRLNGFVALVRVNQGPLATLLGDAEGPAHTEWHGSSRNFKDKYTYGGVAIDFVSNFAFEFVQRAYSASKQLDRQLLSDIFFDVHDSSGAHPNNNQRSKRRKAKLNDADVGGAIEELPPPKPRSFLITELADGFVIASAGEQDLSGRVVRVQAAYETTKGDPMKSYQADDFSLQSRPIMIDSHGCRISFLEAKNSLEISVSEPTFRVAVKGFDKNRDLAVKARLVASHVSASSGATEEGES